MDSVNIKIFEKIKKNSKNKQEFWSARQLSKTLEYADFRNFKKVINDAQKSCENSGLSIKNHLVELNEMVVIGRNTSKQIKDINGTMPENLPTIDKINLAKKG